MSSSGPSSLFNHDDDACHSLEKAQARQKEERQRRMRIFRRIILPVCLLGGVLVLWILKDPLCSLFRKDYLIQQYMAEEAEHQKTEEHVHKTVSKSYGRISALMKIELILPDSPGAGKISEVLMDAVETKPSEIHFTWKQENVESPSLTVNGRSCFSLNEMREMDSGRNFQKMLGKLRQAINAAHAEIYGKNVLSPLRLSGRQEAVAAEAAGHEEYLPEFVGSEKELKNRKKQTLLLLPKAETDVMPEKNTRSR